jgi:hypothetical protein
MQPHDANNRERCKFNNIIDLILELPSSSAKIYFGEVDPTSCRGTEYSVQLLLGGWHDLGLRGN